MDQEEIVATLKRMETDPNLVTEPMYRANAEQWPDNRMPFVEAHLDYLKSHPKLAPRHYLSNLKLRLRKR